MSAERGCHARYLKNIGPPVAPAMYCYTVGRAKAFCANDLLQLKKTHVKSGDLMSLAFQYLWRVYLATYDNFLS